MNSADLEAPPRLLPKKKRGGGTLSTNADEEFLRMVRGLPQGSSFHFSPRGSEKLLPPRRSSRRGPGTQNSRKPPVTGGVPDQPRNIGHDSHIVDEDEVTNFLIEENMRRQKRYFGASLRYPGAVLSPHFHMEDEPVVAPPIVNNSHRNPTLGEIIRGEVKNSSKRSLQNFPTLNRTSVCYSSDRQILPPPSTFSDFSEKNKNYPISNSQNELSRASRPPVDILRPSRNGNQPQKHPNGFSNHLPPENSRLSKRNITKNCTKDLDTPQVSKNVKEVIQSIENEASSKHKSQNQRKDWNKHESPIRGKENEFQRPRLTIENGVVKRHAFIKAGAPAAGLPDHLERDSLDGNLPASSHGTSTGHPPPPPAPPNNNNNNKSNNNNDAPPHENTSPSTNNINGDGVNNNPEGASDGDPAFSKGPNSKVKKHKRLKNENETLDFPNRDQPGHKRPSYNTVKHRDMETEGGYRTKTEPYTYLWVVLSRMYGKLIVLLMLAFCLTEVLDNQIAPLTFQEVFLLYLYVGSIIAIMCIYVTVIIDNCPSITASKENLTTKQGDPEVGSITSFGTLKRAHISRSKTSRTSFYLRVGALVFGLGTLIFNGLEIAMHSSIPEGCVSDTILAHPILQALFTFLQMHFLFVNSEVVVEKFGQIARFGFMHLVATNLAIWVRMVVWESANDSIINIEKRDFVLSPDGFEISLPGPTALGFHSLELQRLNKCYQNNTLGQLWTSSQQYLFPFLVQYSLIAASVTYIMWCNVGKERLHKLSNYTKSLTGMASSPEKRNKGHWKVDCRSASKGLFLGLLVLVGGTVILIIFFVMKEQEEFKHNLFWMCNGTMMIILSLCITATVFGFIQIPKLSISTNQPMALDRLLLSATVVGVYIFSIFGMIVGGIDYNNSEKLAVFSTNLLLLIQVSLQGMLVAEASRRTCSNRLQMITKPGRQVITFLLFSNITLWILDTFMTHNSITHEFQIEFYGKIVWGVISRISLPLIILFRFHSAVILVEIWKNTYRTRAE